ADGAFVAAPDAYATIARALVLCDWRDEDDGVYVGDSQLFEHFIDTHDDRGNEVPGGRPSGLHFPLKAGLPTWARPLAAQTGMYEGRKIIVVLAWDDPLDAVMT